MIRQKLLLSEVNTYNRTHLRQGNKSTDKDHIEGIQKVKLLIQENRPILPILVKPLKHSGYKYQRLDGFKRYMAYKELGYKYIECFVDDEAESGGQGGMSWIDPEAEFNFDLNIVHPKDVKRMKHNYNAYNEYYRNKYHIALACNSKSIIEIGVRAGYSAWTFLQACPTAKYFGFDNNAGAHSGASTLEFYNHAIKNINKYKIKIWNDFDTQKSSKLPITARFVHVDGDHSYEGTLHDLTLAHESHAKWILLDDYLYIKKVRDAANDWVKKMREEDIDYKTKLIKDLRGNFLIENQSIVYFKQPNKKWNLI